MINTLIAGVGGAFGTIAMRSGLLHILTQMSLYYQSQQTYESNQNKMSHDLAIKKTNFINLYTDFDVFTVERGLIAGMVSVSLSPSSYHSFTSLLNGFLAGCIYILSLKIQQLTKLDDVNNSSNVHGLISMFALLSICFFHKHEGFFFRDIYLTYIDSNSDQIAPIILLLGSNSLAFLSVMFITGLVGFMAMKLVLSDYLRVTKVHEIIG